MKESISEKYKPELHKLLEQVDFNTLRGAYEMITRKSGVKGKINFALPNRIIDDSDEEKKYLGLYDGHYIRINLKSIKEKTQLYGLPLMPVLLHILIHEETHAVSHSDCPVEIENDKIIETKESGMSKVIFKTTISSKDLPSKKKFTYFKIFNEGVTEILSKELMHVYLTRTTRNDPDELAKWWGKNKEMKLFNQYFIASLFTKSLVKRISEIANISEDIVWQALFRSFFGNDKNLTEVLKELLEDSVPPDFLEILSKADKESDLVDLLDDLGAGLTKEEIEKLNLSEKTK